MAPYGNYGYPSFPEGAAMDLIRLVLYVFIGIAVLVWIVFYLFEAIGLYGISKKRGYKNAWLSFLPVVNGYVLGGIADNIHMCYGKRSMWRVWVTAASACSAFSSVLLYGFFGRYFFDMVLGVMEGNFSGVYYQFVLLSGLSGLIGLGCMAVRCVALYRIYQDYTRSAMGYLLLSFLVPMFAGIQIAPFLLFSLRNKPSASLRYRESFRAVPPGMPYGPGGGFPPQPPSP